MARGIASVEACQYQRRVDKPVTAPVDRKHRRLSLLLLQLTQHHTVASSQTHSTTDEYVITIYQACLSTRRCWAVRAHRTAYCIIISVRA